MLIITYLFYSGLLMLQHRFCYSFMRFLLKWLMFIYVFSSIYYLVFLMVIWFLSFNFY